MKFINIEIQKYVDGSIGKLTSNPLEESQAEADYHTRLSAAALSGLPCHSVTMLDEEGRFVKREVYKKPVANQE